MPNFKRQPDISGFMGTGDALREAILGRKALPLQDRQAALQDEQDAADRRQAAIESMIQQSMGFRGYQNNENAIAREIAQQKRQNIVEDWQFGRAKRMAPIEEQMALAQMQNALNNKNLPRGAPRILPYPWDNQGQAAMPPRFTGVGGGRRPSKKTGQPIGTQDEVSGYKSILTDPNSTPEEKKIAAAALIEVSIEQGRATGTQPAVAPARKGRTGRQSPRVPDTSTAPGGTPNIPSNPLNQWLHRKVDNTAKWWENIPRAKGQDPKTGNYIY